MKTAGVLISAWCLGVAAPSFAQSKMITGSGPASVYDVPVKTFMDRRFHAVIRQQYDFSCGSAALATLLRYHYDRRVGEDDVFRGMWAKGDRTQIRRAGFSLLDMKRYLEANGLRADGFKVSLDQIADTGLPGIALVNIKNYRHFVVVKGVTDKELLIGDPSLGLRVMQRMDFEEAWNGVYFVLNSEIEDGKSSFNSFRQWAAYSRAPIGARFSDPVSQQALALTTPFFREF